MTAFKVNQVLQCEGLACPLPIVRTKKKMDEMSAGEVLEIRATDRGSIADLQSWSNRIGHQYVGMLEENGVYRHFIRKVEASEIKPELQFPHTATNQELQLKLASGEKVQVIDVREPAEFAFGRIPGAISIPMLELLDRVGELDSSAPCYIVCRTGIRSDMACHLLTAKGYTNVKNVVPGMSAWTFEIENN